MNPTNYYYGYNSPHFGYTPQNYAYPPIQHPFYGYPQPQFRNPISSPIMPPTYQMPINSIYTFTRPPATNINIAPVRPRRRVYQNIQNEFSRGFEFDYDFLPNDLPPYNNVQLQPGQNNKYNQNSFQSREIQCLTFPENVQTSLVRNNKTTVTRIRRRSRSFRTPKIIKKCQKQMTKAGILFTAIIYSVCDCILAPESKSLLDLTSKLLHAIDGSRLNLSKLILPHDRLLTEESIEDLEFEILETRAYRLEKEENSIFTLPVKRLGW